MYKTKYFLTFIVIQLFSTLALCNPDLMSYELVKFREILNNGEIMTAESFLEHGTMYDPTDTSKPINIMYTSKNCMCADAVVDLLQTFFEIFLYGVNSHVKINDSDIKMYTKIWMILAINQFNNIKPKIVKMMDSLFSYADEYKQLRTSDQSLLKSLLSINLFLSYSVNNNPFVDYNQDKSIDILNDIDLDKTIKYIRSLNTTIVQMIGLVERYRSKRCVVCDPYEYNYNANEKLNDNSIHDVSIINNLLEPTLQRINVLINDGSDNYGDFNSKMFDPEYLLFENLLNHNNQFLGNIKIDLNGNESTLQSIYHDVKNTYSIEHILEFQQSLIKIIADVFYIRIYNLSNNLLDDVTKIELTNLQANFTKYIDNMLPSNCSLKVCNKIFKAGAHFEKFLDSFDSNTLTKLRIQFEPENNIELINLKFQYDFSEDSSLFSLINMMRTDAQLTSYRRVVKLLSYESYTNNDFLIVKSPDHMKITNSQSYDKAFVKSMIDMQYVLLAFWLILKKEENYQIPKHIKQYSTVDLSDISTIGFTTPKNYTGKSKNKFPNIKYYKSEEYKQITLDMVRVVVRLYQNSDNKPAVQNILLPLLIHFKDTDKCSSQTSTFDLSVTLQITFLTITLIENYLISNYSLALYTIFLYSTYFMNSTKGPDTSQLRHDLQTYAESFKITFEDMSAFLSPFFNTYSYESFLPKGDGEINFLWNGSRQLGSDVYRNVINGVIDFSDLIRLQWFGVKWFASKILLDTHKLLTSYSICNEPFRFGESIIDVIQIKLKEFLEIEFPKPIDIFLSDMFNATLIQLNVDLNDLNVHVFNKLEILMLFGANVLDAHFTSINEEMCRKTKKIINSMNSEIQKLKKISSENFCGAQNMINSTDLSISPVKNTKFIYYEIVKILIQVD